MHTLGLSNIAIPEKAGQNPLTSPSRCSLSKGCIGLFAPVSLAVNGWLAVLGWSSLSRVTASGRRYELGATKPAVPPLRGLAGRSVGEIGSLCSPVAWPECVAGVSVVGDVAVARVVKSEPSSPVLAKGPGSESPAPTPCSSCWCCFCMWPVSSAAAVASAAVASKAAWLPASVSLGLLPPTTPRGTCDSSSISGSGKVETRGHGSVVCRVWWKSVGVEKSKSI
jgi:hypothetical protein